MQRSSPAAGAPTVADRRSQTACPVCGEPVRGIAAASPGEHRFVGCDHYASARFLQSRAESATSAGPPRIGP